MVDAIGSRMKANYEDAYRTYLPKRMPVIIRVDGKSFSSYTRKLQKPWDHNLVEVMDYVGITLCSEIQGAQMAYIQSDEISVLLHNYKTLVSEAWFNNNLQKMVSVSAGIASAHFTLKSYLIRDKDSSSMSGNPELEGSPVVFDSRAWVMPESEVCNYFLWRQMDATRNAISMLARSKFSHNQCQGKSSNQLQEMLFQEHGINFDELEPYFKRGRCVIKEAQGERSKWVIDKNIPMFSKEREYIEDLLKVEP